MRQTIDETIAEWESKKRSMGCVAATEWFCKRQPDFSPRRLTRFMSGGSDKNGNYWQHVVASKGSIIIDLASYADRPRTS